jgi:hypothetical protein
VSFVAAAATAASGVIVNAAAATGSLTASVNDTRTGPTVAVIVPALAGTTDKSPNPREATATAETFFNEIVFTIFLSFSQIKVDLLSGW